MKLCLGRPDRGAHQGRDLGVRETFDGLQYEYLPRAVGQGRDGAVEIHPGVHACLRRVQREGAGGQLLTRDPSLAGPPLTQYHVDRESVEPGSERCVASKPIEPLPGPHEHVLGVHLGVVLAAAAEAPTQAVDRPHVRAVQLLERRHVAALRATDDVDARRRGQASSGGHSGHDALWMPPRDQRFEKKCRIQPRARRRHRSGHMTAHVPTALSFVLLACAPSSPSPADAPAAAAAADDFEWSGSIGAGGEVSLQNVQGDVTVVPGSGSTVRVRARISGRDASLAKVVVDDAGKHVKIRTDLGRKRSVDARVDYQIEIPVAAGFGARLVSGNIAVEGIAGRLDLETVSGNVKAGGSGDVRVATVSGNATVALPERARRAELKAVSGRLDVAVPEALGLDLAAKSISGRIESDIDHERTKQLVGANVRISRGDRAATVRMETVGGRIHVRHG